MLPMVAPTKTTTKTQNGFNIADAKGMEASKGTGKTENDRNEPINKPQYPYCSTNPMMNSDIYLIP